MLTSKSEGPNSRSSMHSNPRRSNHETYSESERRLFGLNRRYRKSKSGYARNYLLPRGLASVANEGNEKALNHQLKILEKKKAELLGDAKKIASSIEKVSVTVTKQGWRRRKNLWFCDYRRA